MLNVFKNMSLTPGHGEESNENRLENLRVSIVPKDGINFDDLDFDLHIEKNNFGAESTELQYKGSGTVDG